MAEPFQHFVDDYLGYLYEAHPTSATLDGNHLHDDLLEDLSRTAVDTHAGALAGFARRLDAIPVDAQSATDQVEHRVVRSNIEARQFEFDAVRRWERDPHYYGQLLTTSLAAQALIPFASETDRARRILSKLRQVPRLVQSARDNVKDPPAIFVKTGIDTFRAVVTFIDTDLPRVFAGVDDMHLLADLADASAEATSAIGAYAEWLETDIRPKAKASFRLGAERLERKLSLDEKLPVVSDRLLTIAEREVAKAKEAFRVAAGRIDNGDPQDTWRRLKADHPGPGELIATARDQVTEIQTFLERSGIVAVPAGTDLRVAPTPGFLRWTTASLWMAGPFESRPPTATYFLTDALRGWTPERQVEHLREVNLPTLWSITMHQVFPGHYLHVQHLRQVDSKVRRSRLIAPRTYLEGWAHYSGQMMVEAGFGHRNPHVLLGHLADALLRLGRFVVGLRLHAEDWSVEQGVRYFQNEAFLDDAQARREAERATYDPGYIAHAAGRLMLLKLREDWQEQQGGKPSLRSFHDAFLSQGAAPFWALRQLMLGGRADDVLE